MNNNYLDHSNKIDIKRNNALRQISYYCKKCGHTVLIANVDRIICSHCGHWVYKNDKIEFAYKMKEKMKEGL